MLAKGFEGLQLTAKRGFASKPPHCAGLWGVNGEKERFSPRKGNRCSTFKERCFSRTERSAAPPSRGPVSPRLSPASRAAPGSGCCGTRVSRQPREEERFSPKVHFCRQSRLSILATPTTTPTTPTTPTNWSSGCHFRRVCRDGSGHVFSSDLLRISVVPHILSRIFLPAVGARDVIFGRPR